MKFARLLLIVFLFSALTYGQSSGKYFNWNGYGQFRIYKINGGSEGFMLRRLKLWVQGNVPSMERFRYKVMGFFSYNKGGYFRLLDAYGDFLFTNGYLRFGWQITEFSLQREQPDWKIPVMDRAAVINGMIPAAQSSARDVGLQIRWSPVKNIWQVAGGVFNGGGANLNTPSSANFLYTMRSTVKINIAEDYSWHFGGSVMYRKAEQADFNLIFGKDNLFSGDDFRYGFESLLKLNKVKIQAEYIGADFNGQKAYGYYAYINYNFSEKDQAVVSAERFADLNDETNDDLWMTAGYNRLFAGHKVKLMASGRTQFNGNYKLSAQLQLFFN